MSVTRRLCLTVWLCLLFGSWVHAEIEKIAIPDEEGMLFYWWPKLAPVDGWHQDLQHSYHYNVNALAPEGFTFKNSGTVIYAKAIYKPRRPEITSLEQLIENDIKEFLSDFPDLKIQEAMPLTTADGRQLQSFTFFPVETGNWERVSYGEEGEYFLIFTLSSRTQAGYDSAISSYGKLIAHYQ